METLLTWKIDPKVYFKKQTGKNSKKKKNLELKKSFLIGIKTKIRGRTFSDVKINHRIFIIKTILINQQINGTK